MPACRQSAAGRLCARRGGGSVHPFFPCGRGGVVCRRVRLGARRREATLVHRRRVARIDRGRVVRAALPGFAYSGERCGCWFVPGLRPDLPAASMGSLLSSVFLPRGTAQHDAGIPGGLVLVVRGVACRHAVSVLPWNARLGIVRGAALAGEPDRAGRRNQGRLAQRRRGKAARNHARSHAEGMGGGCRPHVQLLHDRFDAMVRSDRCRVRGRRVQADGVSAASHSGMVGSCARVPRARRHSSSVLPYSASRCSGSHACVPDRQRYRRLVGADAVLYHLLFGRGVDECAGPRGSVVDGEAQAVRPAWRSA